MFIQTGWWVVPLFVTVGIWLYYWKNSIFDKTPNEHWVNWPKLDVMPWLATITTWAIYLFIGRLFS